MGRVLHLNMSTTNGRDDAEDEGCLKRLKFLCRAVQFNSSSTVAVPSNFVIFVSSPISAERTNDKILN